MSEEYNPQATLIEEIERVEVELKAVTRKRDQAQDPEDRRVLQTEVEDLQAELKRLQRKLD